VTKVRERESKGDDMSAATKPSAAEPAATSAPHDPGDPGAGLGEHEVKAILDYKKKHPAMGPAQIRAQLKRFLGWRVSVKAIARVLRKAGTRRCIARVGRSATSTRGGSRRRTAMPSGSSTSPSSGSAANAAG
jgi:hypothetical protein